MPAASADAMFKAAEQANVVLTWVLRVIGFFIMFLGLNMVLRPLAVAADVLPFVGSLVSAGTGIVSALVAVCLSLATIAIAWLFYRPLLAILLLVVVAGGIAGLAYLAVQMKKKRAVAPA